MIKLEFSNQKYMDFHAKKERSIKWCLLLYIAVTLILIYAEYSRQSLLLYIFKPLLMPILAVMYVKSETKINRYFLFSVFFIWITNICFINAGKTMFIAGAFIAFISRLLVLLLLIKMFKFPKAMPFIIGTLPFLMLSVTVLELINDSLDEAYFFYMINGLLVITIGGSAMANYFMHANRVNTYILISVIIATFMQFLVAIDFYYVSIKIFRPIVIATFSASQFIFCQSVLMMNHHKEEIRQ